MAGLPDSIPVDKVESLLCCSVCLERLQEPRTLPCFHSYCKHCLENYVAEHREKAAKAGKKIEEFECPCCRTLFPLKENENVANMRGSHFIRNMVDVLNAERSTNVWKCSKNHNEKHSCCRCVACEAFLCEECLKMHENWSAFKGHAVLTIEELKKPENQSKITGAMRCKEHTTKKLKFYCESCQVLICRYCMDFNHIRPEHVCQPVDKVAEKHREALQTCCDVLDAKQAEVEKSLKDVTDAEMALKLAADNAKEEISKQKNDIIKAVEEVFELKMNEVDLVYSNHDGKLASERNKGKSALDKVKCAGNLSRNMLQKGSHEEIIESRIMVEERVENVKKECGNLPKNYKINKKWFTAKQVEIEMVSKLFGAVNTAILYLPPFFKDSKILKTDQYFQQLSEWFCSEGHTWKLCYRASTHGWYAKDFHARCDDQGPTIVLVKVHDYIFGGFTDTTWEGPGIIYKSERSFIFSLRNKDNLAPFKSSILKCEKAAVGNSSYGAVFGWFMPKPDLCITDYPFVKRCCTNFGVSYQLPHGYFKDTDKARCLLAGTFEFIPSEIEVFYQVKN